ncbi:MULTISPECIES: SIMPL domain-containing protein [unclassified Mycobacterium]|uniref:SIMPL domain-containing protein n=1 Tax=unclassified Mycobacterium TaxID=2642494 RepID=UPI0029C8941D|nr:MULTISPECIES: SIMPL domain-containing protein [unclassified Mycobacterium]
MSTEITVRGSYAAFQQPERGTAHVSISYEGADMEPVYERVATDLEAVKASVLPLLDGERGPVTWWSAEQLRTWSAHPWNSDGEQLPLVHHASVGVQVKFLDFQALSRWVGQHVADTEGFRLARVEWALTVKRRDELAKEVRTRAVHDAVTRAQQYADALGLGTVVPVAIADVGMFKADGGFMAPQPRAMSAARSVPDVEFVPADIEVAAEVDARFLAEER